VAAHLLSRRGWRLSTGEPQAVMNVLTPDVAIEIIERIVVPSNGFNRWDGKLIVSRIL
jgi:hypothetical protein